ncbi:MoaD/ThiS family protein [Arthrobacter sp. zg-ZUI100]|uniref:MoaD/ThiS family protein n=1 Tax=Arthrobacter jiangjiafuii TaxID=2817475 RepID=A0A975M5B6_9MICC|nr:MoaD/ThiS family protein [Arthrobacter jiangjiafuii]MBP3035626.1 MoaD/ThiS family protein [Arthrobacter jiangjiafuii]MBP3042179.1 MoaD/ThiS family protein [Arthrobacter jiangjiafuii]QWC10049.1 MoaD/ThiS family protein [Arthrobacter jiangjiafuii]
MRGTPVRLVLPAALSAAAGGARELEVQSSAGLTAAALLDGLAVEFPRLERRIRDEAGRLRRYVNVYIDGEELRSLNGLASPVPPGSEVLILQSVAGG